MSAISDAIAATDASVDAATARVQSDIATLKQEIVDLEAQVAAGTATQADLDALAALKVKVDAIDPATPSTI